MAVKIAIMGPTGTGKSSLIKLLSEDEKIKVGHGVESETSEIGTAIFKVNGHVVVLVDTPGFDDSRDEVTDATILQKIVLYLNTETDNGKVLLNGIIYLHRITDPRMGGIAGRNLKMFRELCGAKAFKNVAVVTTRWDEVDHVAAIRREEELKNNPRFFQPITIAGGRFHRHDNSVQSARDIIEPFLDNEPITLQIQDEIAAGMKLEDTSAGKELNAEMDGLIQKHSADMEALRSEIETAMEDKDDEWQRELEEEREKLTRELEKWNAEKLRLQEELEFSKTVVEDTMETEVNKEEDRAPPGKEEVEMVERSRLEEAERRIAQAEKDRDKEKKDREMAEKRVEEARKETEVLQRLVTRLYEEAASDTRSSSSERFELKPRDTRSGILLPTERNFDNRVAPFNRGGLGWNTQEMEIEIENKTLVVPEEPGKEKPLPLLEKDGENAGVLDQDKDPSSQLVTRRIQFEEKEKVSSQPELVSSKEGTNPLRPKRKFSDFLERLKANKKNTAANETDSIIVEEPESTSGVLEGQPSNVFDKNGVENGKKKEGDTWKRNPVRKATDFARQMSTRVGNQVKIPTALKRRRKTWPPQTDGADAVEKVGKTVTKRSKSLSDNDSGKKLKIENPETEPASRKLLKKPSTNVRPRTPAFADSATPTSNSALFRTRTWLGRRLVKIQEFTDKESKSNLSIKTTQDTLTTYSPEGKTDEGSTRMIAVRKSKDVR